MSLPHHLLLLLRDQQRRPHRIADLASVERFLAPAFLDQSIKARGLRSGEGLLRGKVREKDGPDFDARLAVQVREAEGDVDAGLEGLVESADAVGGKEENALEVF